MNLSFVRKRWVSAFGLDIGASAVKAVELTPGSGGGIALRAYASVPLPRSAVAEGTIKDAGAVADAIRQCVQEAGITSSVAVISIAGREAITKRVRLPRVSTRELADAIMLEAEHHIPYALDEVFVDYQVVRESRTTMDVLLVAVKRLKVLEHVAAVEAAGLEAAIVDLDAFALQNQFEQGVADSGDDAVALLDIGASVMKTNVIRSGMPIFLRDVSIGGNYCTEAIAHRLRLPFETAEAAKVGGNVGGPREDLASALESVSRELALESSEPSTTSRRPPSRSGSDDRPVRGRDQLAGLGEVLSASWGIPVERARRSRLFRWSRSVFGRRHRASRIDPRGAVGSPSGLGETGRRDRDQPRPPGGPPGARPG